MSAILRNQAAIYEQKVSHFGFIISKITKLRNFLNSHDNINIGPCNHPGQYVSAICAGYCSKRLFMYIAISWTNLQPIMFNPTRKLILRYFQNINQNLPLFLNIRKSTGNYCDLTIVVSDFYLLVTLCTIFMLDFNIDSYYTSGSANACAHLSSYLLSSTYLTGYFVSIIQPYSKISSH